MMIITTPSGLGKANLVTHFFPDVVITGLVLIECPCMSPVMISGSGQIQVSPSLTKTLVHSQLQLIPWPVTSCTPDR